MLFINLKDNKIIKEFKYTTKEISTKINFEAAISEVKKAFESALSQVISQDPLATHYIIDIEGEGNATDEEIINFLSIVNVGCAVFFSLFTQSDRRDREWRLDVPSNLMGVKTSRSLMKKAVNYKTVNDVFNFTIKYKDLFFTLCDEKEDSKDDATK